jgi:hypothetical protein
MCHANYAPLDSVMGHVATSDWALGFVHLAFKFMAKWFVYWCMRDVINSRKLEINCQCRGHTTQNTTIAA